MNCSLWNSGLEKCLFWSQKKRKKKKKNQLGKLGAAHLWQQWPVGSQAFPCSTPGCAGRPPGPAGIENSTFTPNTPGAPVVVWLLQLHIALLLQSTAATSLHTAPRASAGTGGFLCPQDPSAPRPVLTLLKN